MREKGREGEEPGLSTIEIAMWARLVASSGSTAARWMPWTTGWSRSVSPYEAMAEHSISLLERELLRWM